MIAAVFGRGLNTRINSTISPCVLTERSWESFVAHNAKVFLALYDPDCPNCQALREHIGGLAKELKDEQKKVKVGVLPVDMKSEGIPHLWSGDIGVPTLYWYLRGGFQAEYTGVRSTEAMMHFIKQEMQQSDKITWSRQESSEDVYHLDDSNFEAFVRDNENTLVFFYSPDCKTCSDIQTAYAEAATIVEEENPGWSLAAVNIRKAPKLKMRYEVNATPTVLYFKSGEKKFRYHGETNSADAFMQFISKPKFIQKKFKAQENSWFGPSSNVKHLDKESLPKFVSESDKALIMFYAPWCGHCKNFKPDFVRAADILKENSATAKLGAYDGSANRDYNSKYDVKGYPTLVYFENGVYQSHYQGKRNAESVVEFLTKSKQDTEKMTEKTEKDEISSERPSEVELLDPSNFHQYLEDNNNALVMFYAPWCGTCKKVKHEFYDAAVDIAEDLDDSGMAIFNADKHRTFASEFGLMGYPTLWYFSDGKKKFKYNGKFRKDAFVEFMENPRELEDKKETTKEKVGLWVGEKDNIEHLSRENFEKTLMKYDTAMVFFYIHACYHCLDTIKPKYVRAAAILAEDNPNILLAAVNGDWEKPITSKYHINSYPSFLYFKNGKMMYKYDGSRETTAFVNFLKSPSKELAKRQKPTSWQDFPNLEFGRVEHLSNKTYDSFLANYDTSVILLHSLWHPKSCDKARGDLKEASERLPKYIGTGAVDCHRLPENGVVCYNLSVKNFPAYKFFKKGIYQKDIKPSSADDIIDILMRESFKTRDEL